MKVVHAWQRFWFPEVPTRRLAALRIIVAGYALFDVAVDLTGVRNFVRAHATFYEPILLLRVLHVPRPTPDAWTAVRFLLITALALALMGLFTRIAMAVAAPLYLWWWAIYNSHGPIGASRTTIVVALLALAVGPAGANYSLDAIRARTRRAFPRRPLPAGSDDRDGLAGWSLRIIMLTVVIAYLSAAIAKLRGSGLHWPFGGAFDAALVEKSTFLGNALSGHLWLVHALAVMALLLESSAWILFLRGRPRDLWCLSGTGFHVGTYFLLDIDFIAWIFLYPAFYDLEVGAARLRRWASDVGARLGRPVQVLYDGDCGLCIRTIAAINSLDWFNRLELVDASTPTTRPEAMYSVDERRQYRGYFAYRRLARSVPALWPTLLLAYVPGFVQLGERVYERVAANRGRTGACSVEARTRPAG
jgi:predicted DCC family thiol-disulfide oxidoreductase YuxK